MNDLLDGAEPPVTVKDMINCATREVAMRKKVYPRWVTQGKMQAKTASIETKRMEGILTLLEGLDPLVEAANAVAAEANKSLNSPHGSGVRLTLAISRSALERLHRAIEVSGCAPAGERK